MAFTGAHNERGGGKEHEAIMHLNQISKLTPAAQLKICTTAKYVAKKST